jgi:4-amino-4-deoxy-L-arabinose transferase-like glycosyltransferase
MRTSGCRVESTNRAADTSARRAAPMVMEAAGKPTTARVAHSWQSQALWIFLVALGLRIAVIGVGGTYVIRGDGFGFGWESGRIARSLATGHGFGNPFQGSTGPTAWLAPLYPLLLAGIFKVSGVYSTLSGWLVLAANSVFAALTGVVLYRLGRELFGERTGRRAGWAWALLPYAIYWPTRIVWDTSLTACLLTLVFLLTVRLGRSSSRVLWIGFGLSWGLLALCNPAALSFAPVSWAWILWQRRRRLLPSGRGALGAALLALLCVAPWLARNYRVFGEPVFIRSNLGEELRLGNGPGASGIWMAWLHPTQSPAELDRYRRMGEVAYVASRGGEALAFIVGHPRVFLANTARRVYWFWCGTTRVGLSDAALWLRGFTLTVASLLALLGLGLMLRTRKPESLLFAGLFLMFPLVYYATFVLMRYRHPIEPELLLSIVYLLSSGELLSRSTTGRLRLHLRPAPPGAGLLERT